MICPSLATGPSAKQRAQGMPGVWLHPQPCVRIWKAHKRSHRRRSRNIDIPCAMVLTGYIVRAPARPAFVSPSPALHRSARLAPAARAPGPHAFVVRKLTRIVSARGPRPSHPKSNVRDDASAPLGRAGMEDNRSEFFRKTEVKIFCAGGLDLRQRRFR